MIGSKWKTLAWVILCLYTLLGCFILGAIFVLAVTPFAIILLCLRKVGEKVDGISWEMQEEIINEKHRCSKRREPYVGIRRNL